MMLDSAISREMERMNKKMSFWKMKDDEPNVNWNGGDRLTLETILEMIEPESDLLSKDDLLLYGIGWEFVWGMTPPELVQECREEVIMKARCGLPMSDMEKVWYELICVDTDMF